MVSGFSEVGQRTANQDCYYPEGGKSSSEGIFIVCDGVGGQAKGDVAAHIVCYHFPKAVEAESRNYKAALHGLQKHFRNFIANNPGAHQMSTTCVFAHEVDTGIQLGWIGDSRIYHFREGQILYQTKDHSMVQALVDKGDISQGEARSHPMNNVITRAVNAYDDLEPDLHLLQSDDIETGDWLFLCTDGVIEAWPDDELAEQFTNGRSMSALQEAITDRCRKLSKDNFTGIILQLNR